MSQFDATLKLLFRRSANVVLQNLTGRSIVQWLDVELPKVQNLRLDLLGETAAGHLVHFEFQVANDRAMQHRMAEYYLGIFRLLRRYPEQILVYAGPEPLRMEDRLETPAMSHRYRVIDLRDIDGETLLASPTLGDNLLAILTRLKDEHAAIRNVLRRIKEANPGDRDVYVAQFLTLAGLRQLDEEFIQEAKRMAISAEELLRGNRILEPYFAQERAIGLREGRQEGELLVVQRLFEKRFGPLPAWAAERLQQSSAEQLEALALRILDATSLEDALR